MKKRLTIASIEAASPRDVRYEISDGGDALRLIVFPSGEKSWALRYRAEGRTRKHTLGRWPVLSLRDARDLALAAKNQVAKGSDPGEVKRQTREARKDTVRVVVDDYIARWQRPRNRTWPEVARSLDRVLVRKFGSWDIRTVDRRSLSRALTDANRRTLANVKRFFAWCVEQQILDTSPAASLRASDPIVRRERVLSDEELSAFLRALDVMGQGRPAPKGFRRKETTSDLTIWPSFLELLALTAGRREEVAGARWSEFDLSAATWVLPGDRTKNGKDHVVALAPAALTIVKARRAIVAKDAEFVFPAERGGEGHLSGFSHMKPRLDALMLTELRKAAQARGDDPDAVALPEWRLHDLRRTAATKMAALGHPIHVVERVLNHVSGSTTGGLIAVYQRHDFAAERAAALADWASFLQGLRK